MTIEVVILGLLALFALLTVFTHGLANALAGTLTALAGSAWAVASSVHHVSSTLALPYPLPMIQLDPTGVSGLLLIAFGIFAAACLWTMAHEPGADRLHIWAMALTVPAAVLVLAGSNVFSMLVGWELLGALSYLLVAASRPSGRRLLAARVLLAFAEFGAAALYALVLLAGHPAADLAGLARLPATIRLVVSLLAIVAFGSKAGFAPFQFWMPFAEPEAPGPAAGLLSGPVALVAVGALLRILWPAEPAGLAVGVILVTLGIWGASWGAVGGMFETHAKRVLALGTVETMNLVAVSIGIDLILRRMSDPGPAAAAFAAAIVLVLMHAASKASLFTLTSLFDRLRLGQNLNRMGGLTQSAPLASMAGALSVVGLMGFPPLGGFVAEWLLLEACFMPVPVSPVTHVLLAVTGAAVAVITAMALTAYLRWFGMAFLGPTRTQPSPAPEDASSLRSITLSASLLAFAQVILGVGAAWFLPWIQSLEGVLSRGPRLIPPLFTHPGINPTLVGVGAQVGRSLPGLRGIVLVPDHGFSILSPWDLAIAICIGSAVVFSLLRLARPVRRVRPWAGGEPMEGPNLTYTASGLTMPLRLAFASLLGLERHRAIEGDSLQPTTVSYRSRVSDRSVFIPRAITRFLHNAASVVRRLQSGAVGHYVLYVLLALAICLVAVMASSLH